jgi:cobalt-zinc-cadmium efflux system protein
MIITSRRIGPRVRDAMHSHAGHSHAPAPDADRRWLTVALVLIAGFMVAEVVAGLLAGSLALLSDAAHMLTDAGAIALALAAARVAGRPAGGSFAALLVLAAVLGVESVRRLLDPSDVDGLTVLLVGLLGAAVNVGAAWALSRAERRSLNVEGARAHVLMDLYASLGAAAAGAVILATDLDEADPVAALVVVLLMLRSGWSLLRDSGRVLLEASPRGLDPQRIGEAMAAAPGVTEVHDLHVWEVTSGFPALAAHVLCKPAHDCHGLRRELEVLLHDEFGIHHTTLQVDHEHGDELLEISPRA